MFVQCSVYVPDSMGRRRVGREWLRNGEPPYVGWDECDCKVVQARIDECELNSTFVSGFVR